MQVDKVVVLWTANTERYSNVSVSEAHDSPHCDMLNLMFCFKIIQNACM